MINIRVFGLPRVFGKRRMDGFSLSGNGFCFPSQKGPDNPYFFCVGLPALRYQVNPSLTRVSDALWVSACRGKLISSKAVP